MSAKYRSRYRSFPAKRKHNFQLEPGLSGFLCTCNSKLKERDCVRESYNILNEFADKLFGTEVRNNFRILKLTPCAMKSAKRWCLDAKELLRIGDSKPIRDVLDLKVTPRVRLMISMFDLKFSSRVILEKAKSEERPEDNESEDDIDKALEKEMESIKSEISKKPEVRRFQVIESGANGIVFIRTTVPDPVKLAHTIVTSLSNVQKSKFLLRLLPIEVTCKAYMEDICKTCDPLFDKYFSGEETTFAIVYNHRNNDRIKRDELIEKVAALVYNKNRKHKTDLKQPKLAVLIEIIRSVCCISVVPDFYALKKYNLMELAAQSNETSNEDEKLNDKGVVKQSEEAQN